MITCTATFGTESDAKQFALLVTRNAPGAVRKGNTVTVKMPTAHAANVLRQHAQLMPSFRGFKTK